MASMMRHACIQNSHYSNCNVLSNNPFLKVKTSRILQLTRLSAQNLLNMRCVEPAKKRIFYIDLGLHHIMHHTNEKKNIVFLMF